MSTNIVGHGQLISFARHADGSIVSIADATRGKACNCTCLACDKAMVARKGTLKWSFAHSANSLQECEWAAETALHHAMKEIIAEEKKLLIPQYDLTVEKAAPYGGGKLKRNMSVPGQMVELDSVALEFSVNPIRPDVVATSKGKRIFIEVIVTHGIDEKKLSHIRRIGASVISIDLRRHERAVERDQLRTLLLTPSNSKTWVFHRREPEWRKNMLASIDEEIAGIERARGARIAEHFKDEGEQWTFTRPAPRVAASQAYSDGAVMCFRLRSGGEAFIKRSPQQVLTLEFSRAADVDGAHLYALGAVFTAERCLWNLTDGSLTKVIPYLNTLAESVTNRTRAEYMRHRYSS